MGCIRGSRKIYIRTGTLWPFIGPEWGLFCRKQYVYKSSSLRAFASQVIRYQALSWRVCFKPATRSSAFALPEGRPNAGYAEWQPEAHGYGGASLTCHPPSHQFDQVSPRPEY